MRSRIAAFFMSVGILACLPEPTAAQWAQTGGPEGCYINALAVDGTKVFAGVAGHGLYSSTDNGAHWTAVKTGLPQASEVTCIEVVDGKTFVGTHEGLICFSTDGGASWRRIKANVPDPNWSRTDGLALIGGDLFAGGGFAVYVYPDYAVGHEAVPVKLPKGGQILSLAVMGKDLFVSLVYGGVVLVREQDGIWTASELPFPRRDELHCLAVSGSTLFAGTDDVILMSPDKGASWTPIDSTSRTDQALKCLATSGPDLLAGFSYEDNPPGPMCIRLSRNGGQKWRRTDLGLRDTVIECLSVAGKTVFAGTSNGVFASRDGGSTWGQASSGLPVATHIKRLAAIGTDVFAGAKYGDKYDWRTQYRGLHRSTNEGRTWTPVDKGLPSGLQMASLAVIGKDLFAGLSDNDGRGGGVYRSTDGGKTWIVTTGLPPDRGVYALAVIGLRIYADAGDTIFVSADNGAAWAASGKGLPTTWISCLAAAGEDLFAGIYDFGATRALDIGGASLPGAVSLSAGGQYLFASGPPPAGKLYVLANGRGKWKDTRIRLSSPINCLVRIGQGLFMGTDWGLYLCENYAELPKPVKLKLSTAPSVKAFAVVGTDLFVGTDKGVILIRKNAEGWTASDTGMPGGIEITDLVVSGRCLYASTDRAGVWRYPISR